MKLFKRADSQLIKQTIAIYIKVIGGERKQLVISSIFIPLQHLLYIVVCHYS